MLEILTLGAFGLEGIRQGAFQFVAIGCAFSTIHQTVEVIVKKALTLQDIFQVNVVILGGIFLSTCESEDQANS
jgi:hypothetical protein